jgi:CheY-like chemotaxis protein
MFRIALVEDNPSEAQIIEMALRKTGEPLQIVLLEDGVEAMDYLSRTRDPCDLVLLDLNLPRLDGFEILGRVRRDDQLRSLPVVVLSGSSNPEEVARCYRTGANSYICKPLHLDEIFAMAAHVVNYWAKTVRIPSKLFATTGTHVV